MPGSLVKKCRQRGANSVAAFTMAGGGLNCSIGEEVKLHLKDEDTVFQGTVFSFDKKMDVIVLGTSPIALDLPGLT